VRARIRSVAANALVYLAYLFSSGDLKYVLRAATRGASSSWAHITLRCRFGRWLSEGGRDLIPEGRDNLMTVRSLLAAVLLCSLASCGNGDSNSNSHPGAFKMTGQIVTPLAARAGAVALLPAHVAKVVAFSSQSSWWVSDVSDGHFTIGVDQGAPVGLVFAGADDQYLGYLRLPSGFDSVPLQAVGQGVSGIDLGELMGSDGVVAAGHDPVGAEISLSATDQAALQRAEGFFGSVVRNPDADGNGKIDVLEGRFYRPFIMYFVEAGTIDAVGVAHPTLPVHLNGYTFALQISQTGGSFPSSVTFSGPNGSALGGGGQGSQPMINADWATYWSPTVSSSSGGNAIPPAGTYTAAYAGQTLSFSIPDQTAATAEVAVAVPAVTLNPSGTIQSVAWTYRLGDQTDTIDPRALIQVLLIQIDAQANTPKCSGGRGVDSSQGNRVYNSSNLAPAVTQQVLECQNIPWTDVAQLFMAYNDVYGNHVVVHWVTTR
jgi:hypothetical protein